MRKLTLFVFLSLCYLSSFAQIKETIDKDIGLINYVPYGESSYKYTKQTKRKNKQYREKNKEYREILAFDTLAIHYLINKISDTSQTKISVPCNPYQLKRGDIAFILLNEIVLIPWSAVTHSQWDAWGCGPLPIGGWDYLRTSRTRFREELEDYFLSSKGKAWIKLFKEKHTKEERAKLVREL